MANTNNNITANIEVNPDIIATLSNATYRGSFAELTPSEKASLKGEKGDKGDPGEKGDSGVFVGSEEPTSDKIQIWIDPSGETTDFREIVAEEVNALTNLEIEALLGGN